MTPEDRFQNIENLLNTRAENHVLFHTEMQKLEETQVRQAAQIDKHNTVIDKHNAAIRDLIVVSRTVLDSILALRDAQRATDEKLRGEEPPN